MKRFRHIYIILPLIILVFFAGVQPVHAGWFDWGNVFGALTGGLILGPLGAVAGWLGAFDWAGDLASGAAGAIAKAIVGVVVGIINFIIIGIATVLFAVANWVLELSIAINTTIQDSLVIHNGFNIVLDVANLGLVVAIIVTAFMVMLRRSSANKMLIRFIAAALIINFSFFIVTNLFIKPVNEITIVLHEASNFDPNAFAATFVTPGGISDWGTTFQQVRDQGETAVTWESNAWADIGIMLLGTLFLVGFIGIGVFVLFSFAIMFFVRYVALGLLIVMMPIAILAWVFPGLKIPGGNPWNLWVENFTRWLLFAPIGMFFFFLAIQTTTAQDVLSYVTGSGGALEQIAGGVGNMMMVIGFLLGGIIVANKMSITGAKLADNQLKKAGKWVKGRAWEKTKIAGTYAARRAGREFDDEGKRLRKPTLTERAQRAGRENGIIGKTLKAPLRGLGNVAANARIAGEKAYKTAKERVDKLSIDEMEKRFDSEGGAGQLAILTNIFGEIKKLNEKEEKGKKDHGATFTLDKDDERRRDRLIVIRDRIGNETNLRGRMEKLRGLYGQDVMRVGKKAEELFEAAKEEGRTEARTSAPTLSPAPPPTAPTAPTP